MRHIPNIFTLLNLFFGCIAIVLIMQNGLVATADETGPLMLTLPEQAYWASLLIGIAAIIDFFDGLVARAMNLSSELGRQLDSLADLVSFGVAPGLIIYQFLRLAYAQHEDGLDVSFAWLLPAFLVPCAGAYRLARFNIDRTQRYGFKGVPIPAAGILIASFPLIYWFSDVIWVLDLLKNEWFLYAFSILISYLMVSRHPMMALKFDSLNVRKQYPKLALVLVAAISGALLHWLAVPIVFVIYVLVSLAMPGYARGDQ